MGVFPTEKYLCGWSRLLIIYFKTDATNVEQTVIPGGLQTPTAVSNNVNLLDSVRSAVSLDSHLDASNILNMLSPTPSAPNSFHIRSKHDVSGALQGQNSFGKSLL